MASWGSRGGHAADGSSWAQHLINRLNYPSFAIKLQGGRGETVKASLQEGEHERQITLWLVPQPGTLGSIPAEGRTRPVAPWGHPMLCWPGLQPSSMAQSHLYYLTRSDRGAWER